MPVTGVHCSLTHGVRGDQKFHYLTHLDSQPVSDLFLVFEGLPQQHGKLPLRRQREEPPPLEQ